MGSRRARTDHAGGSHSRVRNFLLADEHSSCISSLRSLVIAETSRTQSMHAEITPKAHSCQALLLRCLTSWPLASLRSAHVLPYGHAEGRLGSPLQHREGDGRLLSRCLPRRRTLPRTTGPQTTHRPRRRIQYRAALCTALAAHGSQRRPGVSSCAATTFPGTQETSTRRCCDLAASITDILADSKIDAFSDEQIHIRRRCKARRITTLGSLAFTQPWPSRCRIYRRVSALFPDPSAAYRC